MKLMKQLLTIRKSFLLVCGLALALGLPSALACRQYINKHRMYVFLNVFVVRDMNGNVVRHNFEFYIRGQKQGCSDHLYWP